MPVIAGKARAEEERQELLARLREMAYERLPYRGAERVGELLDDLEILWSEWESDV